MVRSFFVALTLLVCTAAIAGDPPTVQFDPNDTPLAKAIRAANLVNAQKKNDAQAPGEKKDRCAAAILAKDDDEIAKRCDVAGVHWKKIDEKSFGHPNGRSAGRRVVTQTTLEFDTPDQRGKPGDAHQEKWPHTTIKSLANTREFVAGASSAHSRGSAMLPTSADNDDRDCVDTVTGERLGGRSIVNGDPRSCYDASGALAATLTELPDHTGCVHRNGSIFSGDKTDGVEDDCWDAGNVLKTTLREMIDEDGPEELDNDGDGRINEDGPGNGNEDDDCIGGDGTIYRGAPCHDGTKGHWGEALQPLIDEDGPDAIDNDGDGQINEDGPNDHSAEGGECQRLYARAGVASSPDDQTADGQCDLTRGMMLFVNNRAKGRGQKRPFKIKDDGTPDPDGDGIEPGTETRRMTITESFGHRCKPGSTYIDGICFADADVDAAGGPRAVSARMRLIGALDAGGEPQIKRVAMMGFTFAPPEIEWGYGISEEVCVLGFCVEIFSARVGYDFALAVGLRLPVEVQVPAMPASVLAGRPAVIEAQLEPLDFTAKQYEDFCREHKLDEEFFVSDCKRFGFPDFVDAALPFIPDEQKDGDEFVARYTIFAGLVVRVFGFDLINWGIDSNVDVPAALTMKNVIETVQSLKDKKQRAIDIDKAAQLVEFLINARNVSEATEVVKMIKDLAGNVGSFTTPFGKEPADDPLNPGLPDQLRQFPLTGSKTIRADCASATKAGDVITIGGKARPICTGLLLGVSGASLGIDLGIEAGLGSDRIDADYKTSGDAKDEGSRGLTWRKSANESGSEVAISFLPDNYDGKEGAEEHDKAYLDLQSFIYRLNSFQISLSASLEFGGILDPIPNIASFPLYSFSVSLDSVGIPIPQHSGTEPVRLAVPVENYGLKVNLDPSERQIEPGQAGPYGVGVRNIGSVAGNFDHFRVELSNHPDQQAPFSFAIDRNTDHDCVDSASGKHYFGDPYDGREDDCYDANGHVLSNRVELIDEDGPTAVEGLSRDQRDDDHDGLADEDPPENWSYASGDAVALDHWKIGPVPQYQDSTTRPLTIVPFRHPLVRPGNYPFRLTADSVEAKDNGMAAVDPSGHFRLDATRIGSFILKSFFDPQVAVLPNANLKAQSGTPRPRCSYKPGLDCVYDIEGTNGGNVADAMTVARTFLDFNGKGQCTLTTLGRADCPYRAVPTAMPTAWATPANPLPRLPAADLMAPLDARTDRFTIRPPRDWAAMTDTTYEFQVTTTSVSDSAVPKATRTARAKHTVIATKESMTRYIGLELDELAAALTTADSNGVNVGGLKPIVVKPIQMKNGDALSAILGGNFARASNEQSTEIQLMQGFVKQLNGAGKDFPAALFNDLTARSTAILTDLAAAQASAIPSAP